MNIVCKKLILLGAASSLLGLGIPSHSSRAEVSPAASTGPSSTTGPSGAFDGAPGEVPPPPGDHGFDGGPNGPVNPNGPGGPPQNRRGGMGVGIGAGGRNSRLDNITPAEREGALAFMQAHSPERYKAVQSLPEGPRKANIINIAARVYRNSQQTRERDPEVYAVLVKRVETEDRIFGLWNQFSAASTKDQPAIREQLRSQVAGLVKISLNERQLRIDHLRKTLDDEQKALNKDAERTDKLVDERLKSILQGPAKGGLSLDGPRVEGPRSHNDNPANAPHH